MDPIAAPNRAATECLRATRGGQPRAGRDGTRRVFWGLQSRSMRRDQTTVADERTSRTVASREDSRPLRPRAALCTVVAIFALFSNTQAQNAPTPARPTPQDPPPKAAPKPAHTYSIPVVPTKPFAEVKAGDEAARPGVLERQRSLLEARYDLSNRMSSLQMSGGRKAVQEGVRVRLPDGMTWERLAAMAPDEIRSGDHFPHGFLPLPHVKHAVGGMVFPQVQIDQIRADESRDLARFDVEFDLPDHLTPEFPPPIFLTTHPERGDVSKGQLLTIRNYYELLDGLLTPVQMEGLRLLLTPFPQQQFNQTEDRKVAMPSLGVSCFDCHSNGHTNATFHLNPDTRPQSHRFRIDTVSLRGVFNQQIHGSKRSLRSIEDFTEFEQRTAYFDGDHVTAAKKGVHLPRRSEQVAMMAQLQNMLDFPPAPPRPRLAVCS